MKTKMSRYVGYERSPEFMETARGPFRPRGDISLFSDGCQQGAFHHNFGNLNFEPGCLERPGVGDGGFGSSFGIGLVDRFPAIAASALVAR